MHSAEHRFSDFRFLMTPLTDFSWDPNEMIKLDLELNNRLSYIVGMNRKNAGLQMNSRRSSINHVGGFWDFFDPPPPNMDHFTK